LEDDQLEKETNTV